MSHVASLYSSPLLEVRDSLCTRGKSGRGGPSGGGGSHVALVRRGCFEYHLGSHTYFADACKAFIYDEGAEYHTSHPCDGGDDCTIIELDDDLMAEIFGARRRHERIEFNLSAAAQLSHLAGYAALKGRGETDRLACEEIALGLLRTVAQQPPLHDGPGRAATRQARMVNAVKLLLNDRLDQNLGLNELAREVGCSPYHLMRMFRVETAQSVRGYRARLRVAAALARIADGAEDLMGLALDVGFASHSHLTDTFRAVLGVTPSRLRQDLGAEGFAEKRRFLEASLATAA
jgi:AraC family transcriptional regulator